MPFYREVLADGDVWTIRDGAGFPAPEADGCRAMPLLSAESRAQSVINNVEGYTGFKVVSVSLDEWRSRCLPGLKQDGLLVGLHWSGDRATGYELDPDDVDAVSAPAPLGSRAHNALISVCQDV
jgi:hypothetical protein